MRGFLFSDVIIEIHRFFIRDMNQDQSELDKFNAVSDSWWDPYGHFRPLHDLNPVRLGWIAAHVSLENKNILDIGCGGGILSESLAREKATVTGIDLAENALQTARKHCHHSGFPIRYIAISAEDLAKKEAGKCQQSAGYASGHKEHRRRETWPPRRNRAKSSGPARHRP